MTKKLISAFTLLVLISTKLFAQQTEDFGKLMSDPNSNFFEVQKAFNAYHERMEKEHGKYERWYKKWRKEGEEEEESGYEVYKRWEYFMQSRVDANGKIPDPSIVWNEWQKHHQGKNSSSAKLIGNNQILAGGTWTQLGPLGGEPTGGGTGRLTFIRFDPTNSNIIWVGAPAGGLWKSSNGGQTWSTTTDALAVIGCSDLAIDPTNTNIMYLATGDRDAGDTYSIGILKSIDGGLTWNTTGLSSLVPQQKNISALLINPTNTSMVLAATTSGIYRTLDGGVNWQLEKTGTFKDMEYKPGDPTTVYAAGQTFCKSVDSGDNWSVVGVGT
ncbi:MAG: WD40/YVTN/BNR-like repeat-containing protein, partial [Bacteroidia bacterium]